MKTFAWFFWMSVALAMAGCSHTAELPVSAGTGMDPVLPPPAHRLIPTVNVAPAIGWPAGSRPMTAAGTQVSAFAAGLDHPRWIYVLPNGDVLVAESSAPAEAGKDGGFRGWIMQKR
jgi:glucose/arabinose dehydrogenase